MVTKRAHVLKNGFDAGDFPDVLVVPATARLASVVCHCGALFYVPESYRSWKQRHYEALSCPEGCRLLLPSELSNQGEPPPPNPNGKPKKDTQK